MSHLCATVVISLSRVTGHAIQWTSASVRGGELHIAGDNIDKSLSDNSFKVWIRVS